MRLCSGCLIMYKRTVTVINNRGLHTRTGSDFVKKAAQFKSQITIRRLDENDKPVNAKSLVYLLALGVSRGVEVELSASGEDEKEAVDFLAEMISEGFGDL